MRNLHQSDWNQHRNQAGGQCLSFVASAMHLFLFRSDESSSSSLESEDEEQDEEDHAGKGLRTI